MHEVLEISSDEEEGLEESLTVTDLNLIREMLFSSDEESDDSVQVVEICENKPELKSKSSTLAVEDLGGDDDVDDDCVVLEGDPENGVASVEEEANGSDELLVIGEKGQTRYEFCSRFDLSVCLVQGFIYRLLYAATVMVVDFPKTIPGLAEIADSKDSDMCLCRFKHVNRRLNVAFQNNHILWFYGGSVSEGKLYIDNAILLTMAKDMRKLFEFGQCILPIASEKTLNEFIFEDNDIIIADLIACRDYPHPRHLCAKFPFSSTPHEKHCSQCHCYVCDSPAPCLKWGTGGLSLDHCHASDKTELWKTQRKNFKLGLSSPLPASTNFGTSLRPGHLQRNEFLPPGVINLSPNSVLPNQASRSTAMCAISSFNSVPQTQASPPTISHFAPTPLPNFSVLNQVSRSTNTPIMSPATNITMPNGANHGRLLVRSRFQPPSVPRSLLGVSCHTIQKGRGNGGSSLKSQFLRPHMVSRGVGSAGNILRANNSPHRSSGFSNSVNMTQHHNYGTSAGFSNYGGCNEPYDACPPTNVSFYSQLSSQPSSLSCVNQQTVASETQAYTQPLLLLNSSQGFHQTSIQVNSAPSGYVAHLNSSQHGNELQIQSQNRNVSRNNTTQCGVASQDTCQPQLQLQPYASRNTAQCGIASQATCQPQPHEESPRVTAGKFSAFDSSWTDNTGQSILQTSGSVGQTPNVKESIEPVFECSQSPSSFTNFDDWLLDIDPFPVLTDSVLETDLNVPSPDLYSADMGLFYLDGN
ncbi:unnamed protein product [Sphenostylis stenocarpa]|uniref:Uncharacterized protein n=1 Tax=Sphenostylis stenocarpa TaxID=92480 RepID=A0AA86T9N3_9FABA|nr:unnamed protein product [Sphenostylis stenocarpa]